MLELLHDAAYQRTLPLPVLADEGDLVASLDGEVYTGEDLLRSEGLADTGHLDGVVTRAGGRREAESDGGGIDLVDLYQLELLEHAHATLHLIGLGVSALEALDEVGRLCDELLLLLVGLLLLLPALRPETLILGVVDLVVVDLAHRDL